MENFGKRLRALRIKKKLSIEVLAEKAHSCKSYIWTLENKPFIRPSAKIVYDISKVLNTTVGALLGEQELDVEGEVFFRVYKTLNKSDKIKLFKIMHILKD